MKIETFLYFITNYEPFQRVGYIMNYDDINI